MFVKVENFDIESKSKRDSKKLTCIHVVIIVESLTIVSPIIFFELELVPMFFHMDSIREFKSSLQNWSYITIVDIIVGVKGGGNNKGEK